MPVYPYQCPNCDFSTEFKRSIHDKEPTYPCQECGYMMIRIYEPSAIQFKGGGFYKNGG